MTFQMIIMSLCPDFNIGRQAQKRRRVPNYRRWAPGEQPACRGVMGVGKCRGVCPPRVTEEMVYP